MTRQPPRQRRPRALIALGWLLIVQGTLALTLFGGLITLLLATQAGAITTDEAVLANEVGRSPLLISAGAGIAGIFSMVSGVGLLRGQAWAWLLALITQGLALLVALIDYWLGRADYLTLALGVMQVYLLNRTDVQQAVRPADPHIAEALPPTPVAVSKPSDAP